MLTRFTLLAAAALSATSLFAQPPAPPTAPPPPAPPLAPREGLREQVRERVQERLLDSADIHKDLEYAKVGDRSLKLDLFVPKSLTAPAPLVIWVHGGGWQAGSKENCPAIALLKDGFAVASIQYRLTDAAAFPAQIHDVKAAVRYLRAHSTEHKLDPNRFGAWGASAGGHLVALVGTSGGVKDLEGDLGNADQSSKVQCVCDWFGPSDFLNMPNADTAAGGAVVKLLGGKPSEKKDVATAASPVTHITPDDPPFLIMHGDEDKLVGLRQSQMLEEKLKKAGVSVKLEVLKGEGHGFRNREALEMVREFFKKQLKPAAPDTKQAAEPKPPAEPR